MLGLVALLAGAIWYFGGKKERSEKAAQRNPTELKLALFFGLLYGIALLAVAMAKDYLGGSGLYIVAMLASLTDMDAITLSTTRFVSAGRLNAGNGWRLILIALMANLVFKAGSVVFLGHRRLLSLIAPFFAIVLTAGALLLWLWPAGV